MKRIATHHRQSPPRSQLPSPAGQAANASYNGPRTAGGLGRANTECFCLGNGTIQVRA